MGLAASAGAQATAQARSSVVLVVAPTLQVTQIETRGPGADPHPDALYEVHGHVSANGPWQLLLGGASPMIPVRWQDADGTWTWLRPDASVMQVMTGAAGTDVPFTIRVRVRTPPVSLDLGGVALDLRAATRAPSPYRETRTRIVLPLAAIVGGGVVP